MFKGIGATSLLLLAVAAVNQAQAMLSPHTLSFAEEILLDAFDEIPVSEEEDFEFFIDGEDHRHLILKNNYVDPGWWKKYKQQYGKQFKRCKFQENTAPVDGTACRALRVGDYTCMFEDQICADGSVEPAIKCDCAQDLTWKCESYNACAATAVTECPKEHPVTFSPPLTCSGDMSCPIGTETCCGEEFPKYECTCKDGEFDCNSVNACAGRVCEKENQCPNQDTDIAPVGEKCSLPSDVRCAYGEVCCCDNCNDETTCSCDETSGEWLCSSIAMRCAFPCPPTPPSIDRTTCSIDGEVVGVGKVECCGSTLPEWECTCSDGTYKCVQKNSPTIACICVDEECPGEITDTPPAFDAECSAVSEGQTCSYQETCCCNNCIDSTVCTCRNGSWRCAVRLLDCFDTCPPAIAGTTCETAGEVVPVGPELECCGSNIPQFECTCVGGTYTCKQQYGPFDACLCAEDAQTVCPGLDTDTPPERGTECAIPAEDTCSYKEICCCNDCMDSTTCSCQDGLWSCQEVAFGCLATCPPPISGTACTTEGETFNQDEKECCGSTLPVWEVTCTNGTYGTKLLNDPTFPCLCLDVPVE